VQLISPEANYYYYYYYYYYGFFSGVVCIQKGSRHLLFASQAPNKGKDSRLKKKKKRLQDS